MSATVICIGPNLLNQDNGSFHVHAAGCADINRNRAYRSREFDSDKASPIEVQTLEELVSYVYADQIAEDEDVTAADLENDFYVFPCVKGI